MGVPSWAAAPLKGLGEVLGPEWGSLPNITMVPSATELSALKWLLLHQGNFMSIKTVIMLIGDIRDQSVWRAPASVSEATEASVCTREPLRRGCAGQTQPFSVEGNGVVCNDPQSQAPQGSVGEDVCAMASVTGHWLRAQPCARGCLHSPMCGRGYPI